MLSPQTLRVLRKSNKKNKYSSNTNCLDLNINSSVQKKELLTIINASAISIQIQTFNFIKM